MYTQVGFFFFNCRGVIPIDKFRDNELWVTESDYGNLDISF